MTGTDLAEITGTIIPSAVTAPAEVLSDRAREAVASATPASTRRKYEGDWADFTAWCAQTGRQPFPASAVTLVEYATYLCYDRPVRDSGGADTGAPPGLSPATVRRTLSAIRSFHDRAGAPLPKIKAVNDVIKGYQDRLAKDRDPRARSRQASAIGPADLEKMVTDGLRGEQSLIQARDAALIYLNFSAVTRVSELILIDIGDIAEDERGLTIAIHRVKQGKYTDVRILKRESPKTVAVVKRWISILAENGRTSGPLFPPISKHGEIAPPIYGEEGRISERTAERRVSMAASAAGIEGRVTIHSGRRGFATYARLAGHDHLAIKRHGGWADDSPVANRYMDEADAERLNPLRGLDV